ncbi:MAG: glutaredoxin [Parcubacteria group bacterium Gr01-1014_17]|nr:MAG: glutaredoxin [Parcubacteria group bacterium Gr01-1014_17]
MLIVYTKTGCPWCKDVLAFLREKKVAFEEREVRGNPTYFNELRAKSGQDKTPTLDLNGAILADTDKDAVDKFLIEKKVRAN